LILRQAGQRRQKQEEGGENAWVSHSSRSAKQIALHLPSAICAETRLWQTVVAEMAGVPAGMPAKGAAKSPSKGCPGGQKQSWHMNCEQSGISPFEATMKTKFIKTVQDYRGVSLPKYNPDFSTPASIFLMRLRTRLTTPPLPKRRLVIPVSFKVGGEFHASPVKITHI
jgi:hypothetical protein